MGIARRQFTDEFKREAVGLLASSGRPLSQIAQEYGGHGHTLTVLAVALLASAIGTPASNALAVMERPRAIFWASLVGAVLTAVLVWRLTIEWGLAGAAYGFLAGSVAGGVGRWAAFSAMTVRPCANGWMHEAAKRSSHRAPQSLSP